MNKRYFISGIGTDVGKTLVAAVLLEKLKAHYWKPVQCGTEGATDADTIRTLNPTTIIHSSTFCFDDPVSPHQAAQQSGCQINMHDFHCPGTSDVPLIIEGAGGLLVPLNDRDTMLDLAEHLEAGIILVIRHYLGSINHSLLSMEHLKNKGIKYHGYILSGKRNIASEHALNKLGYGNCIGCIEEATLPDRPFILSQTDNINHELL